MPAPAACCGSCPGFPRRTPGGSMARARRLLADGTLRIASGLPSGRSIQLNLAETHRPIAFSPPLPRSFEPVHASTWIGLPSIQNVLGKFEHWLRPLAAQFCLASHLIEHESALGAGVYHVIAGGKLLAVVNMQGEVGCCPPPARPISSTRCGAPGPRRPARSPNKFVRCQPVATHVAVRDAHQPRRAAPALPHRPAVFPPAAAAAAAHAAATRTCCWCANWSPAPASIDELLQRHRLVRRAAGARPGGAVPGRRDHIATPSAPPPAGRRRAAMLADSGRTACPRG